MFAYVLDANGVFVGGTNTLPYALGVFPTDPGLIPINPTPPLNSVLAANGVTLVTDKTSPQIVNTPVTFTAFASGGTGTYEYRFFDCGDIGQCTLMQNYSTNQTWTLTTPVVGFHQILVHVRSAGSTAALESQASLAYQIVGVPPATTGVTLFTDKISPQVANTPVTFVASGSGGSGTYEYRFFDSVNNGPFTLVQNYSTTQTWTTTPVAGIHQIVVHVRSVGSTAALDSQTSIAYSIVAVPSPATGVTLFTDKISPQVANTPVTFVASGSGGSGIYEYRFFDCGAIGQCALVQNYSTTQTWTLTTPVVGFHQIIVHARNAGSTADIESQTSINYLFE
jgi:hypothetical protein